MRSSKVTPAQIDYIVENYTKYTNKEISQTLGIQKCTVQWYASKSGLKKIRACDTIQEDILRSEAKVMSNSALAAKYKCGVDTILRFMNKFKIIERYSDRPKPKKKILKPWNQPNWNPIQPKP